VCIDKGEAVSDKLKIIKALINAGADLNYRTDNGKSVLNYGKPFDLFYLKKSDIVIRLIISVYS
jgi:hypothetical protein